MHSRLRPSNSITRRDAIRKTLVFSSALLTAGWTRQLGAALPVTSFPEPGMDLLAFGDFGTGDVHQKAVAAQMAAFAKQLKSPPAAVLTLGDNFYGKLTAERFAAQFEEMYPAQALPCPFHVLLGNHDYGPQYDSGQGVAKAQMQLDYARDNPSSRWKMPAKWYALELPDAEHPLVKIIYLDSNLFEGALTPQEKLDQQRFMEAELKKETRAPWLWIAGHHPLFLDGLKGDDRALIDRFGPYIAGSKASMYLCGHVHTLQHLEVPDYKASFVITGGGGAPLHPILLPSGRGFSDSVFGFCHLRVSPTAVDVQYIGSEGQCMHAFRRTLDGQVKTTV